MLRRVCLLVALSVALAPAAARAEPAGEPERWHLITDGDLYTVFAVRGDPNYSLHMSLRPPQAPEWIVGIGFFGGLYPDFYTELLDWASGADNDDWEVIVDGALLRAFYFLDPERRHFFVGTHAGVLRWDNHHDASGSRRRFIQPVVWPAVGYRWFPGDGFVFLSFWGGVGVLGPSFAEDADGPERYEDLRLIPFAAAHLGVEL